MFKIEDYKPHFVEGLIIQYFPQDKSDGRQIHKGFLIEYYADLLDFAEENYKLYHVGGNQVLVQLPICDRSWWDRVGRKLYGDSRKNFADWNDEVEDNLAVHKNVVLENPSLALRCILLEFPANLTNSVYHISDANPRSLEAKELDVDLTVFQRTDKAEIMGVEWKTTVMKLHCRWWIAIDTDKPRNFMQLQARNKAHDAMNQWAKKMAGMNIN